MHHDHDSNGACGKAIAHEMKYKNPNDKTVSLPCHLHGPWSWRQWFIARETRYKMPIIKK